MKKYNYGLCVFLLALSGLIFVGTARFPAISNNAPGAGFWPRMLAGLLVVLSLLLAVETYITRRSEDMNRAPFDFKSPGMKLVYKMLGIFAAHAVLLYLGGFILASLLFIPAVMKVLGETSWKVMAITSLSLTGSVFVFFTLLLRITLPLPFFM